MTKMAVANYLVKKGVAYYEEDGHLEVRSWWPNICSAVEEEKAFFHSCGEEGAGGEVPLHAFPTIYGKYWMVGGCLSCGKIFYHKKSLTIK